MPAITIGDLNRLYLAVDGSAKARDPAFLEEFRSRRIGLHEVIKKEKNLRARSLVYKLPAEAGLGQQAFAALAKLCTWLSCLGLPCSVGVEGLQIGEFPRPEPTPLPPPA